MTQSKLTDEQVREVLAKKDVGYAILFEEVHRVSMSYLSGVQRSFWKIALRDLAETTLKNEDLEDELAICKKALSKQSKAIVDKVLKGGAPCQSPTNRMPKTVKLVESVNNLKAEIEEKNEYIRTNLPDRPFKIILAENARYKAALQEEGISIEPLADYAHNAWAGWMKHLFKLSSKNLNGSVIIPKELVARWTLQIETPYVDLPEGMKPSDRKEANKMLSIITEALKGGTPC